MAQREFARGSEFNTVNDGDILATQDDYIRCTLPHDTTGTSPGDALVPN